MVPYPAVSATADAYQDAVYTPSLARVYFVPNAQATQASWHYIDNTGAVMAYTAPATASGAYFGGAYSPTLDRIYFAPYDISDQVQWVYIDCAAGGNVVLYAAAACTTVEQQGYSGAVYSSTHDRIYFTPWSQSAYSSWCFVDNTGSLQTYAAPTNLLGVYYASGGNAVWSPPQARIYFPPETNGAGTLWYYLNEGCVCSAGYTGDDLQPNTNCTCESWVFVFCPLPTSERADSASSTSSSRVSLVLKTLMCLRVMVHGVLVGVFVPRASIQSTLFCRCGCVIDADSRGWGFG